MLVLTRRLGEVLRIGDGITIKVVEIKGKQVKVGISAPIDLPIYREEVYEKVQAANRLSSELTMDVFGKIKEAFKKK